MYTCCLIRLWLHCAFVVGASVFEKGCSKEKGAIWIKMMQNFGYNPFTETDTKWLELDWMITLRNRSLKKVHKIIMLFNIEKILSANDFLVQGTYRSTRNILIGAEMNEFEMEGAHKCSKPVISCLEIPGSNIQNCKLQAIEDTHWYNSRRVKSPYRFTQWLVRNVKSEFIQNWANVHA